MPELGDVNSVAMGDGTRGLINWLSAIRGTLWITGGRKGKLGVRVRIDCGECRRREIQAEEAIGHRSRLGE